VAHPHHCRTAEKRLAKAQKPLSRRRKGSKRWWTAARLLAKKHQKAKRQRRDVHHKTALWLIRRHGTLSLADLRAANLVRKRHLSTSISDADWRRFRTIRTFKAAWAGKRVVLIEPACTAQDCSRCGACVAKSLLVRTSVCPSCGLVLERDQHAAKQVLR